MDIQTLEHYYELETTLLRLTRRQKALKEELRESKFDLRSRDEKLLNYRGGIRFLLHRITGKQEETEEALRREVRQAEAQLAALQRERSALEAQLTQTREELQHLPDRETLRRETEGSIWAALEAKFCADALSPLLEENHSALLEYRSLMQGNHPEILSPQRQQEICAEPNVRAEQCLPYLHRLKQALEIQEIPFEPGAYYDSPAAFLVAPAAMHNRRDRINQALNQVETIQKFIKQYE